MTQTVRCSGAFRLQKANPVRPRRQHATFQAAESEAKRLHAQDPTTAFLILQEIACVGFSAAALIEQAA